MPNLFPLGYENEIITEEEAASAFVGYRPGIAFDDLFGDFVLDGRNNLLGNTGIESWKSWCVNCIQTERYKHLGHGTDFGIELEEVFRVSSREEAESLLTRQITEAIMADPYQRTEYIEELTYDWIGPDSVLVKATLRGIDDVTIDIEVSLEGGKQS